MIIIISTDNQGLYAEIRSLCSFRKQIFDSYTLQLPKGKQLSNTPWWRNCSQHYDAAPPGQSSLDEKAIASTAKPWQRFGGQTLDLHQPLGLVREDSSYREKPRKLKYPFSPKQKSFGSLFCLFLCWELYCFFWPLSYLSGQKGKFLLKENFN